MHIQYRKLLRILNILNINNTTKYYFTKTILSSLKRY
jgi:hypothetical protein